LLGCGGASSSAAVNAHRCAGIVSPLSCSAGFRNPAFCTPIPMHALPLLIPGKSRMRKCACTDLCGGRSAMVVPTATVTRFISYAALWRRFFRGLSRFRLPIPVGPGCPILLGLGPAPFPAEAGHLMLLGAIIESGQKFARR